MSGITVWIVGMSINKKSYARNTQQRRKYMHFPKTINKAGHFKSEFYLILKRWTAEEILKVGR